METEPATDPAPETPTDDVAGVELPRRARRFEMWAGFLSVGVLEEMLGDPVTSEPLTIYPIVDKKTCGPIDGYPRTDQFYAVTFSSKTQETVALALEQFHSTND